jgi:hypothetical protein
MLLAASLALTLQPYLGISSSDLGWNIAASTTSPNILSELRFEDVRAYQAGLAGNLRKQVMHPRLHLFIEGEGSIGRIQRGVTTDLDFLQGQGENSGQIASLSESRIGGDDDKAYSAGVGFSYALLPQQLVSVSAGGYLQESDINFREGRQLIADPAFFQGTSIDALTRNLQERLNSNYLAEWSGYWLAGQWGLQRKPWSLHLRYQYHRGDYYGEGRWNLRAEGRFPLQQPRSFSHHADSSGDSWALGLGYQIGEKLALQFDWLTSDWETASGTARIFFADGTVGRTRLDEAQRSSSEIRLGLSYTFE